MAVERHPGLEAQGVPRAEPSGQDPVDGQQGHGEPLGVGVGHGDLEAVLAGVPGPRHPHLAPLPLQRTRVHEGEAGHGRDEGGQGGLGGGALQGQQGPVGDVLDGDALEPRQPGQVVSGAGGVDHQQEPVAVMGDHQVVEDPAPLVGEESVALPVLGQAEDAGRDQGLQRGRGLRQVPGHGADQDLAHVRHVEEAGVGPRVQVLGHHPGELHRQLPTGEFDELSAQPEMEFMQRSGQ